MKTSQQFLAITIAILIIFQIDTLRGQMATQGIVPQSPDAAQLGFFGTASVGMFTGTLQQSIPLYEFKTANLTLPITLNYSSNGLIVDKVASWVGHDWSLEAGGIITVSVKGRQDSKGSGRMRFLSSYSALYIALNYSSYEFQPDEYSFNFNGYSGMFFLNAAGDTAFINPYQKMKISTSDANNDMHNGTDFIITTADGIKYIFKAREIKNCLSCENYDVFPTSWYLTSIIHPAADTINLYYETPWLVNYYAGLSQNISVNISNSCSGSMTCSNSGTEVFGIGEQTYITYLDSIKSTNYGTIIFEKTSNRKDYTGGKRLNKIVVKNSSRQIVRTFEFGHNFYKSNVNYPNGNFSGRYASGYLKDLKYRMFLSGLTIKDSQGGNIQNYAFEYKDTSYLPARLSFSQDHWGYFNGKGNNQYAPKNCVPAAYSAMFPSNLADKSPDYVYSQRGMLSKIVYPTGGYSTFEYEAHSTGTSTIGGCRVKKILTYDNASTMPVVKRYFYSNGQIQGTPNYYNTYARHNLCMSNNIPLLGVCYFASLVSNSLTNMYASNGNNIVYESVTVSHGGDNYENGGEVHNFDVRFNNPGTSYNSNGGIILPLPYNNDGWYSGTKSSELIFKINSSGNTVNVRRTSYNYNRTDTRNRTNYSCLALINRSDEQPSTYSGKTDGDILFYFDMVRYQLQSVWQQLTSKTETEYDDSGNEQSTVTTYYYDNATHAQLSRESTANSKGETILKKFYYPHDYTTTSYNISNLKSKFILNKPIDVRTYTASKITSLEQYKYNTYGQTTDYYRADISPTTTDIAFNAGSPYTASHKMVMTYNTDKKLVTTKPEYDISTSYIWGYKGQYPVAKIVGVDYATAYNLLTTAEKNTLNGSPTDEQVRTIIKKIRDYYINNFGVLVYTYTYKPLVGMTSETDENGKIKYYEYDNFGRLITVRDQDQQVIQEYKYHYKQ